jgi:C4-dicarboxylate transporter DctM subunit
VATVLSMTAFSSISGSSMVTLLAVGGIMYPALIAAGYSQRYALGVLCCGGTLGVIIPPSLLMVVYGIVTEVSITAMFLAGWGPGLLLAALLCIYSVLTNLKMERKPFDLKEVVTAFKQGITALLMPVILLGGIYTGFFTVTESAALALLYACVVDVFVHRELNGRDLVTIFVEATKLLGALLPLIAIASSLNVILDYEGVPQKIVRLMQEHADTQAKMMVLINVLLLVAGALMDEISAIVILAPLLAPLGAAYGYDPVHFATILIVNLQIGYVAPPVALNLFVAMVAFNQPFKTVVRAVIPFIGLMLITLVITAAVPSLSLFLVR